MRYLVACALVLGLGGQAIADTIHVPGDYSTIYQAIDAAVDGDVIEIAAGTYYGSYLSPQGKHIIISGVLNEDGSHAVILDGQQSGAILWCYNDEDTSTVFRNLVLTNGSSYYGGGLSCYDGSSPALENCIIRNNTGTIEGGGVHLRENCNPHFIECRFENNVAHGPGGGIYNIKSSPTLSNCTFSGNMALTQGGGIYTNVGNPTLQDCLFCDNSTPQIVGGYVDAGGNTIEDECHVDCPGDYDASGYVDVGDLLFVISNWQNPYEIDDLLLVISQWNSSCP